MISQPDVVRPSFEANRFKNKIAGGCARPRGVQLTMISTLTVRLIYNYAYQLVLRKLRDVQASFSMLCEKSERADNDRQVWSSWIVG